VGKTAASISIVKEIFGETWRNNFIELNARYFSIQISSLISNPSLTRFELSLYQYSARPGFAPESQSSASDVQWLHLTIFYFIQ
jgi:hypothetical protein